MANIRHICILIPSRPAGSDAAAPIVAARPWRGSSWGDGCFPRVWTVWSCELTLLFTDGECKPGLQPISSFSLHSQKVVEWDPRRRPPMQLTPPASLAGRRVHGHGSPSRRRRRLQFSSLIITHNNMPLPRQRFCSTLSPRWPWVRSSWVINPRSSKPSFRFSFIRDADLLRGDLLFSDADDRW